MPLLVCYKVDLSEIDKSGFISVAISGGSYCIFTGLGIIKGCKTIIEVGFAIRSPESKMAAKIYKTALIAMCWLL